MAGVLWTYVSPTAPFVLGACTAAAATVLLGAYAVSIGIGPRTAKVLLAAIVVAVAVAAGVEHNNLGVFVARSPQLELPVVLTRPCVAPPSARVTPTLPQRFPSPAGVTYTIEQQSGRTHIVDGFLPMAVDKAHNVYLRGLGRSGYAIQREELQLVDSEVFFAHGNVTGEVRLLQECSNRTYVQITTTSG